MKAGPRRGKILAVEREAVDRTARSDGILAPVMYRITGDKDYDCPFIGEVIADGGSYSKENRAVSLGDYIVCSLFNVGHRVLLSGQPTYSIMTIHIGGKLDPLTFELKPVQHYVLVAPNPERAKRLSTGGSIIELSSPVVTTDDVSRGNGLRAEWGEVLATGPGQMVDGHWEAPDCSPGDMVLYDANYGTTPVLVKGRPYVLVSCLQIIFSVAEKDEETWIQKRLKDRAEESGRRRALASH